MQLHFVKASTCRNTTAFMEGDIPNTKYAAFGKLSMDADYLAAEQAGFLVKPENPDSVLRLEMAGSEFCGNATLALGALAVNRGKAEIGRQFFVECSGASKPLSCVVNKCSGGHYDVSSEMPKEAKVSPFSLDVNGRHFSGGLVELPGIAHFCIEEDILSQEIYDTLMDEIIKVCRSEAFGVIVYTRRGGAKYSIRPYVCVPSEASRVFEQACGTGSLALGLWMKVRNEAKKLEILQPSEGVLLVDVSDDVPRISADVYFPCEGSMWVDDSLAAGREE